jgi:hypothetical protein
MTMFNTADLNIPKQAHSFEYEGETVSVWQAPNGRWRCVVDESHIFDGAPISGGPDEDFDTPEVATDAIMAYVDEVL